MNYRYVNEENIGRLKREGWETIDDPTVIGMKPVFGATLMVQPDVHEAAPIEEAETTEESPEPTQDEKGDMDIIEEAAPIEEAETTKKKSTKKKA